MKMSRTAGVFIECLILTLTKSLAKRGVEMEGTDSISIAQNIMIIV